MAMQDGRSGVRGGIKVGLIAWLLGAPLLVILVGFLAC